MGSYGALTHLAPPLTRANPYQIVKGLIMGLIETVENGDELEILKETRRAVAAQIDNCSNGHDLSSLADKMERLSARIASLERQRQLKRTTALDAVRKVMK